MEQTMGGRTATTFLANHPRVLDEQEGFVIAQGAVDIYAQRVHGSNLGPRHHVMRLPVNAAVPPVDPAGHRGWRVLAVALPDTQILVFPREQFGVDLDDALRPWVGGLADAAGVTIDAWHGKDLPAIHRAAWHHIEHRFLEDERRHGEAVQRRSEDATVVFENALTNVSRVLDPRAPQARREALDDDFDATVTAMRMIGERQGFSVAAPQSAQDLRGVAAVPVISEASGIRHRPIRLDTGWPQRVSGSFLGYDATTGEPVAVMQRGADFDIVDPLTGAKTPARDDSLQQMGWQFFTPFPPGPVSGRTLIDMALFHRGRLLALLLVTGLAAAFVGLAVPIASGILVNTLLPQGNLSAVLWIAAALLAAAVSAGILTYARSLVTVKLSGIAEMTLQGAVWDRLLSLPTSFFRQYSVGDLMARANSITAINNILSNSTIGAVLSSAFGAVSLLLLFAYDATLAWVSLITVIVLFAVILILGWMQIPLITQRYARQGQIYGSLFQLISGVEKVRIAGREVDAFSQWSSVFYLQKRADYQSKVLYSWQVAVISSASAILTTTLLFGLNRLLDGTMSVGAYVAFSTALAQFAAAVSQLGVALSATIAVGPLYKHMQPILLAKPEQEDRQSDPGRLEGSVALSDVTFRYQEGDDPILENISIAFEKGRTTALVGPSGAGKSTVVRLLLGFEKPEAGSILFDDRNLESLDLRSVRRQIGIVLQGGKPMPGDILHNIIGSSGLTEDDAWIAAEKAGLANDIRRMPMGMRTIVSEGGVGFSGGQVQRLLIARALAHKPKIIVFDEATSALDNEVQAQVTEAVLAMDATRIVIAHRLSTVRHADRILVINHRRVEQDGTFEELAAQPGLFADLVRRQSLSQG